MEPQDAPMYYEGQYSAYKGTVPFVIIVLVLIIVILGGMLTKENPCGDRWDPGYQDCVEIKQQNQGPEFDYPHM